MIEIAKDSTGNTATFQILDSDGIPNTSIAYNAAGLVIFYTPHGGTQVAITLSSENWHEKGNGWYEVDVADSVYASVRVLDFGGVITDGHVIGERQSVVEDLYSEAGVQAAAAAAIAAAGLVPVAGPVPVTITVTANAAPLPNVEVAVYDAGILAGVGTTEASGQVPNLGLAHGTYTVVLYHGGYTATAQTLVVPDDGDPTYTMTAVVVTGSTDPDWCYVYADVYDDDGQLDPGAAVSLRIVREPTGSGHVFGGGISTVNADANGRVAWAESKRLPIGCQIEYWRGAADADPKRAKKATIAAASVTGGVFWLPKIVGV